MKLFIDVAYQQNTAKVVGGFFTDWKDASLTTIATKTVTGIHEYIPGEFYKRELPCILSFLADYDLAQIELIIIDGFVYLDNDGKKGLGAHLYESLEKKVAVAGVAKTKFHNNGKNVVEVLRGESKNPLYISAAGIDPSLIAGLIQQMHGEYRIPLLLQLVDTETKK